MTKWSEIDGEQFYSGEQVAAMKMQFEGENAGIFDGMRLNVRPDPVDYRDIYYNPTLVEVPAYNHAQMVLNPRFRVRRQGSEGSCTGQALAAVLDLQNIKRYEQGADVPLQLSSRMAYENAKVYDDHPDDGLPGSSLRGAVKGFYHCGLCDERKARYIVGDVGWQMDKEIAKDARAVVLGAYFRLRHILNHYHTAIAEVGAILCSAMIHEGWERDRVEANGGEIKLSGTDDGNSRTVKLIGGHAFAIVGYDQSGFLVVNSRSRRWGRFNPVENLKDILKDRERFGVADDEESPEGVSQRTIVKIDGKDKPIPGVAHWSYDDWARHVLDAWVLRLTAPTRRNAWYGGGYHVDRSGENAATSKGNQTPRRRDAFGHFLHMRSGVLVDEPPYNNTLATFRETARILREKREGNGGKAKYKHLLFYAHGGLDTIEIASERSAVLSKTLKANGVYPIFFFWRTGFGEMVQEVLRGLEPRISGQARANARVSDHLLERLMNPIGSAIWRDIRENAYDCFAKPLREEDASAERMRELKRKGGAWDAVKILLDAARNSDGSAAPMKIHYAGHSSGIFLLQSLASRIGAESLRLDDVVNSISLFAPACTIEEFARFRKPIQQYMDKNGSFNLYTLPESEDKAADLSMEPYRKSLLHLVSNSFHETRNVQIAGLRKHWEDAFQDRSWLTDISHIHVEGIDDTGSLRHGDFDNSAGVMNDFLARIISAGDGLSSENGGFRSEDLRSGLF